jgi:hypothetical protein
MIQPRLLAPPTAGRPAEQMEAAHLCKEWLSCLERWPGTGGTPWRLYTIAKRHAATAVELLGIVVPVAA